MYKTILSVFALMIIVLSTLAGCTTVIRTPPPARVEIRPGPPHRGAVWVEGHWVRRHGNRVWIPGHWRH